MHIKYMIYQYSSITHYVG